MWIYSTFIVVLAGLQVGMTSDWGYWGDHGPKNWPGMCLIGKHQSPINIITANRIKKDLGELKFVRYDHPFTGNVTNSGHTIRVDLTEFPMRLESEYLSANYSFDQMHFHWGSEHTIDDQRYPLELHLVHYDDRYVNPTIASENRNGLVVVSTLFEISNKDNEGLKPIISAAKYVSAWVGSSSVKINGKIIPDLLIPKNRQNYYIYEGSLTTPECNEAVTWFVMNEKLTISEEQLEILRSIESPNGTLKFNYRPSQSVGDRKIYYNLPGYSNARSNFSIHIFLTAFCIFLIKLS